MLVYGIDVPDPAPYGPAVEAALDDIFEAACEGRDLTDLRRAAERTGATRTEIAATIADARAAVPA